MTPSGSPSSDEPVLATPPGLVLPAASAARLRRQFDRRPPGVVGVVAPTSSLPAGSSVTAAADWASMLGEDSWAETTGRTVEGAAMLEAGIAHVVGPTELTIESPGDDALVLLVDPGAPAFDPAAGPHVAAAPGPEARPPFRWRPVVVLLAAAPVGPRSSALAALADALVDLEVEARLALHDPLTGPMLTAPCLPDAATVAALQPDLVVAVDPGAVALAEQWSAARRSTVVARLDPDLGDQIELVAWTIGSAQGRLRARVGDRVEPAALARLVNRLCSGPLAGPPTDDGPGLDAGSIPEPDPAATPVTIEAHRRGPRFAVRRIGVVAGPDGPSPLLAGLADHLAHAGHQVVTDGLDRTDAPPDLTFIDADDDPGPSGSGAFGGGDHAITIERADGVTVALTASATTARRLRCAGTPTLVVPVLPTRAAVAERAAAADRRVAPAAPIVGWLTDPGSGRERRTDTDTHTHTEPRPAPAAEVVGAMVAALDTVAVVAGDLHVVLVAPPPWLTEAVGARPWVTSRGALPHPAELASWSAVLWSGPPSSPALDAPDAPAGPDRHEQPDDPGPNDVPASIIELALTAIPVVAAAPDAVGRGARFDPALQVLEPRSATAWAASLVPLLDEARRAPAAERVRRIADALHGDPAAALVVDRILGWCDSVSAP